MVQQLSIVRICLYWPRFYLSLLKHKRNRHSIWKIITNPVTPEGSPKVRKPSSIIVCLNLNLCWYSFYQVQGAYTHLNKWCEKDLDKSVSAATTLEFYDETFHLEIPCMFLLKRTPKPPEGLIRSVLSLKTTLLNTCTQFLGPHQSLVEMSWFIYIFNILYNYFRPTW